MFYKNIYGTSEYEKCIQELLEADNEDYFCEEETVSLPDNFNLNIRYYKNADTRAKFAKCSFRKGGNELYKYLWNDSQVRVFKDFILHSNGHRYYPFHVDLYGISYIDVDTLDVFNYIPNGDQRGESFIITDVYYDIETDLIAYGGCYWAAPYDIMVGDFSEPLNFNPKLICIHDIVDPDYEKYDDIDFDRWENKTLCVKADFKDEYTVSAESIAQMIIKK